MTEEFVDRLRTVCGESLRVVANFESIDYELAYFREDLREQYSDEDVEAVYREVIAEGLSVNKISDVMDAGHQQARITVLEEAIVFVFPIDRLEGIFVSVDRDAETTILDVVDTAHSTLPTFDE